MKHKILFVDESGKATLTDEVFDLFLLTGVILDNSEVSSLELIFNYVKRKYKINITAPFHAYDVLENSATKLSDHTIKNLMKDISEFISYYPLKVKLFTISKKEFKSAIGALSAEDFKGHAHRIALKDYPYKVTSAYIFKWFAHHLNSTNTIGQIFTDARHGADYELLQTLTSCKNPNSIFDFHTSSIIRTRCTAICFADKNFLSGGLEIADLISYVSFLKIRGLIKKGAPFYTIYNPFWNIIQRFLDRRQVRHIRKNEIRSFFRLKKGEIHKYLKINKP